MQNNFRETRVTDQLPPQQPGWQPQETFGSQLTPPSTSQYQRAGGPSYGGQQPPPGYFTGPQQPAPPGRPPGPKKPRRGLKIVGAIIYSFVVLMIGVAIGSAGSKPASPAAASNSPASSSTTTHGSTAPSSPATTTPPVAAPTNHELIRFIGSGIRNSAPFNVGSGPLTVTYSFNCSDFGQSGNFQADLLYGNQSRLNSDDQVIANDLALHGGQTTTIYPSDAGKDYYLSVNSECTWKIKVTG